MQAGSTFGYRPMLFVILIASLGAVIFQVSGHFDLVPIRMLNDRSASVLDHGLSIGSGYRSG